MRSGRTGRPWTALAPLAAILHVMAACGTDGARQGDPDGKATGLDGPTEAVPGGAGGSAGKAPQGGGMTAGCGSAPEGMTCIPGGSFMMGGEGSADYLPPHEVEVDAFYIDTWEVTNEQFTECIKAGVCSMGTKYRGFTSAKQPAVPVTWYNAGGFCRWAGKRLPTEAEWEKAAKGPKGGKYPWGEDPPTCDKAAYKNCNLGATLPVGSLPPNGYGLYDMAGNSYEWVQDWYAPCIDGCERPCGEACRGKNPKGPCSGKGPCEGYAAKVLKGGSWYWGPEALVSAWRRAMIPMSGVHRLGFRCAMDADRVPVPSEPAALTEEEKTILFSSPEDEPPPMRVDERHYLHSNENAHELFFPYLGRHGGGYIGVGADQNFTLIAEGRPQLAWIIDYDRVVILLHRIHRAFILESPAPEGFLGLWDPKNEQEALAAIRKHEKGNPSLGEIEALYTKSRGKLHAYFQIIIRKKKGERPVTWLSDPQAYAFIRDMHRLSRIRAMVGNLLGDKAMKGIGAAARELGVTIRALYLTNVEEFIHYDKNFIEGIESLPFDPDSVILRTVCADQGFEKGDYKWHYNIQAVESFKKFLPTGIEKIQKILGRRQPTSVVGVSTMGI